MILTAAFLFDLESNMRVITENTYTSLSRDQWVDKVAKEFPSMSKKERIIWLLETGFLEYGVEGQAQFREMGTVTTEYENKFISGSGLKMLRSQLEDLDGGGIQAAAAWSRTMGALAANFKQQEVAKVINDPTLSGTEAGTAYDGVTFFHANAGGTTGHPIDPTDTSKGRFANLFTGAASANNAGACPISGNTVEAAQQNLTLALSYIQNIKQPNGVNPRKLQAKYLFVPTALYSRALLVTGAKFVATGDGSLDVSNYIDQFGLEVVKCPELGANFGGSDSVYYIGCVDEGGQLGGLSYVNREPFSITYHGPQTDAQLASKREFEWLPQGRSTVGLGHPYLLFKVAAT
jgi:hypothetical protein